MRATNLFAAAIGLLLAVSILMPNAVHGQPLTAGVARVNLTPPLEWKYSLGGYGARMSKPAEGIHDWIWAKALVLEKGDHRFALVTADILAFPPTFKPKLIERVRDMGFDVGNLMLLPSHSHASLDMSAINSNNVLNLPQIGIYDPRLEEFVVNRIEEVIRKAGEKLVPVRIGVAADTLAGLNRNRRGDGVVDRELIVARIDRMDGTPLAVLVNWTAHPTILSEQDMLVSGSWPGVLQRELEDWIGRGVVAMYFNGAEGDQSPSGVDGGSRWERMENYGRRIAIHALDLYLRIQPNADAPLDFRANQVSLPPRTAHPQFALTGGAEYGLDESRMKILLENMVPPVVTMNAVRIGRLVIVGVPGEMIGSLGLEIKRVLRRSNDVVPAIGGLANEWISYILSPEEYDEGGYEASVSFYGRDLGPTIVRAATQTASPLLEAR